MRSFLLATLILGALACSGDGTDPGSPDGSPDPDGSEFRTGCDAAPILGCVPETCAGVCVAYSSERGWSSCSSYHACVETALDCPPGACTPECEAALCPEPYRCSEAASEYFTCLTP